MNNYGTYITHMIHSANHYRPSYKAILNTNDPDICFKHKIFNLSTNSPHIYRDVAAGLYTAEFEDSEPGKYYFIDIPWSVSPTHAGQRIAVYNPDQIEYRSMARSQYIKAYSIEDQLAITDKVILPNTINSFVDIMVFTGCSEYGEPDPIRPTKIKNRKEISVISTDMAEEYMTGILFNNMPDLIELPSGLSDIYVVDTEAGVSYVIKRCGSCQIENPVKVQLMSYGDYSVFFIKHSSAAFAKYSEDIACTHFKSVDYNTIADHNYNHNAIAMSDDWMYRHEGFFIKINSAIASNEEQLINYISAQRNAGTPIEVIYPLMKQEQKIIISNMYNLRTYFGGTKINVTDGYGISCCYKSLREV